MREGLSTNRRCVTSASCLVDAGRDFVFRYHSQHTRQAEKRLDPKEAAELARAGLFIATVYQDRARNVGDFGTERGRLDASAALFYAGQVGQPPGSAVYFAVDFDASASELQSAIVPYFRAVRDAFVQAGGGSSYLKIGVYGSGLACRLIAQHLPELAFTWLAEATGWRESRTYAGWDVRQHVNDGQSVCSLGTAYERCEALDDFGQFRPVGFDVRAGEGERRRVRAAGGNLRYLPTTQFNAPITLLPQGHELRVLGGSAPGWVRVRATLQGGEAIGHMAESRLEVLPDDAPPVVEAVVQELPRASLAVNDPSARRQSTAGRAFPLGEPGQPMRNPAASAAERCEQLRTIADWLSVESSQRYQPTPTATYCNIYAFDYCTLADVYLPRVWWTDQTLVRIGRGDHVEPVYAQTVREMRADDLFAWLVDCGPSFGWRRVFDPTALQAVADAGGVGVICADREAEGRPGHITVVVPEHGAHRAERDADGNVTQPLQSQAGGVNRRWGSAGPNWWWSPQFRDRGFFVHE